MVLGQKTRNDQDAKKKKRGSVDSTNSTAEDQKEAAANTAAEADVPNVQTPVTDEAQDKKGQEADPPAASNRGKNTLGKESKEDTTGEGTGTSAKNDMGTAQDGESKPGAKLPLNPGSISDEEDEIAFSVRHKGKTNVPYPYTTAVSTKYEPKKEEETAEQGKRGRGRPPKKSNVKADKEEDSMETFDAQPGKQGDDSSTGMSADKVAKTQEKKANARTAKEGSNQEECNGSIKSKAKKSELHAANQDAVGSSASRKKEAEGTAGGGTVPGTDKDVPANLSVKGQDAESEKAMQQGDDRMDVDSGHADAAGTAAIESKLLQDKSDKRKAQKAKDSENQRDAAIIKEKVTKAQEKKAVKKEEDSEQASPSGDKKSQDSAGQKSVSQASEKSSGKTAKPSSAGKSRDDEEKKPGTDSETVAADSPQVDTNKKEVKLDKGKAKANDSGRQDDEASLKAKDKTPMQTADSNSNSNTNKDKSAHAGAQSDDVAAERRSEKQEEGKRPRRSTAPTSFAQFAEPLRVKDGDRHGKSRTKHEQVEGEPCMHVCLCT
jgi:hypothetical protein